MAAQRFPRKRAAGKRLRRALLLMILAALLLAGWMYWTAISDPIVRRTEVTLAGLADPIRTVLISDIHVGGPDMPPERLERIVGQVNALGPDLVLIAGDLVTDKRLSTRHYSMAEAVAPLAGLRPRIGSFAVLGNHDHWRDAGQARAELRRAGIRVLDNDTVQAGPIALGGVDDDFTGHADVPRTVARLRALTGPRILLSHSPDPFPRLPPDVPLMLAGHTHCGQVSPPVIGPLKTMSDYGNRYACGRIDEAGRTLVVTAGLGTSGITLRLGAVPDLWVIELRPAPARPPRR
jgi:predicted MPP superfamily phosphohydrolase